MCHPFLDPPLDVTMVQIITVTMVQISALVEIDIGIHNAANFLGAHYVIIV